MAKRKKSKKVLPVERLPVLNPNVAGIDLGAREHWVCCPQKGRKNPNVKKFSTVTSDLNRIASWLHKEGVTSVAMESTSVFWIPLFEILEAKGIEVFLVNSRQLCHVPGRKTDMQDCQWLQLLHSCGLLRGSFRPNESICRLRAMKRQAANLVEERTKTIQWMQKALDQMNVNVHHAVSKLAGKTGLAIIRAIVDGERDPLKLAELKDCRCRKSLEKFAEYLTGNWKTEHLFNLRMALKTFDQLQETIEEYELAIKREIEAITPDDRKDEDVPKHPSARKERLQNRRGQQALRTLLYRFAGVDLTRVDGIGPETAMIILTEVGLDLSAFPDEKHFVSWLRLSPRTSFSAGKPIKKRKNGMGATRLSTAFRIAARSLLNTKTALGAELRRLRHRKGMVIAIFAVARKLATLVYRMLRYGQDYVDVGDAAYEERFRKKRLFGITASAKELGYNLVPLETAS